jgi:predicted metal-dependent peptidase
MITLYSLATITKLSVDNLQKMSTEEITKNLENNQQPLKLPTTFQNNPTNNSDLSPVFGDDLLSGDFEGEILQDGESTLNTSSPEKLGEMWRQICEKAKTFAKQAGTLPVSFERLVAEVLEVKPPWQTVLRFGLQKGLGCDSSFVYPNRRSNDLPGQVCYAGMVWCLIDTSGSISQDILQQFLGIAKHEARQASLRVIPWDTTAYEVLKAERPREVARRIASNMKGGGGTICLPVLQRVYKLMHTGDAIIILTDGYIFDAEKPETQTWFRKVANKAGFAMLGYTQKPLNPPGFSSAYITLQQP